MVGVMTGIPTGNRMHNVPRRAPPKFEDTVQAPRYNTCTCPPALRVPAGSPIRIPAGSRPTDYCRRCTFLIDAWGTKR